MKRGEFIINGIHCREMKSLIQQRPVIPSAKRKKSMKPIPGVSGDYIFDEEAYENVPFPLELFTTGKSEDEINQLREHISYIFDSGGYIDLLLYSDPEHVYEVTVESEPTYQPDGSRPLLLPYSVGFSAKPFKRLNENKIFESSTSIEIDNPTLFNSKPEIVIYGTGNFKLHVNNEEFAFQSIDEHVVIDSVTENAYKEVGGGIVSRNHRMYSMDFPILYPGVNVITTSGNATSFVVKPRWVKKI